MRKYEIEDVTQFSKKLAKSVARDGGYTFKELKEYINVGNVKKIVKKYSKLKNGRWMTTDENIFAMSSEILDWLLGVETAKLAADDILNCYWSDEKEAFMFSAKDKKKFREIMKRKD
jgi:hypothetical protein